MDGTPLQALVKRQKEFFASGRTRSLEYRLEQLRRLRLLLKSREEVFFEALRQDLGKSAFESYATELSMVYEELDTALKRLPAWAGARRVRLSAAQMPGEGRILPEPYGVALIISPWNYPVQLTLIPLVSALAAGNCAVVKPSAQTPRVSRALAELIRDCFPPAYVAAAEGGREESGGLLAQPFDTIFFTGSAAVGKTVMHAAAERLIPVTLELGGKSPVIVDDSANLRLAARRILWGKTVNSGQTCVAPDYVLADSKIKDGLLRALRAEARRLWGSRPLSNPDYPHIVNERHFDRLLKLMKGEHIYLGGQSDRDSLRIEPTVLDETAWGSPVMGEEIFGPLLPVIGYDRLEDAVSAVRARPRPLALYLFTARKETEALVMRGLSFGGGCVNDTLIHLASSRLPFGGVGASGMGCYHGKYGFDAFTHEKSIVRKGGFPDLPLRYPPYRGKLGLARKLLG